MDFFKNIWKSKQTKIVFAALFVVAVLTAAFFLAPDADRKAATLPESSSITTITPTDQSSLLTDSTTRENTTAAIQNTTAVTKNITAATKNDNLSQTDTPSSTPSTTVSKDKYQTDPIPSDKPKPEEPQDVTVNPDIKLICTLSIRCDTILNNMDKLKSEKLLVLPSTGIILDTITVTFSEGESVFDVLKRVTREKRIHMEFKDTPIYNSAYIQGINNLYEFDCGALSGWMYKVSGWFPNYGASRYVLKNGDVIEWVYTCDLGNDVGGGYAVGGNE